MDPIVVTEGPRVQLATVIDNVMTNAVEAMPHGGRLIIRADSDGD